MKTRPIQHRVSILLRDIPQAVRDQFKAYCARRGTSMRATLEQFMRDKCNEDSKYLEPVKT